MRLTLLALLSVAVILVAAEPARFDNYRTLAVKIANDEQREFIEKLREVPDLIDVVGHGGDGIIQIVVSPHKMADVDDLFAQNGIQSEVQHDNLQELIDNEQPANRSTTFSWTQYHNFEEIYAWLDEQLARFPDILQNVFVGRTFEGRQIRGVRLSHKKGNPVIFIDAGIHAREWIAPATATFVLNELLSSTNPSIVDLAQNTDWIIVPVLNVDGYSWTHTDFRLWRKTRQPHVKGGVGKCVGADPNRNYDIHWGSVGTSPDPCSEIYLGPRPFSEPEALAHSNYLKSIKNLRMYLTFHSYGQYYIFPPGYRGPPVPHHNHLMQVGRAAVAGARRRYDTRYRVGPIGPTLDYAAGGSDDWAYHNTNASMTYCVELRDRGQHAFLLPANQIIPTGLETVDGIVAMVHEARKLRYL